MDKDNYWRGARLKSVVDGDTVRLLIDLGFNSYNQIIVRLAGVVAPKFFRDLPEEQRSQGIRTREFVIGWFRTHSNCSSYKERWPLMLHSLRPDGGGRYLGEVYCLQQHSLIEDLLHSGLVRPFEQVEV